MKKFLLFLFLLPVLVFGRKTTVSSLATLTSTFSAAVGGDTIEITNGTYNWGQIFINNTNNTSTSNWIVVKAQTKLGVVFTGTTYIGFSGNRIHVDGFKFANGNASTNPVVGFRTSSSNLANYSQVSNIYFDNYNTDSITENEWVALYGVYNRVDHCSFINKSNARASVVVWYSTATFPAQSTSTYHLIDSNYFFHRSYMGGNGGETIRVGVGNNSRTYGYNIIEHNLFEDCIQTEPELVSNKSAYNTYRYNTFKNCNGGLTLRMGKYCSVYSNFFINNDVTKTGSYGIRIIDKGHKVYNNYCEGLLGSSGNVGAMRCPIIIYNGTYPASDSLNPVILNGFYLPADDALVAFNTVVNCNGGPGITIGYYDGGAALNVPTNVSIANNVIKMTSGQAAYLNPVNTGLTYFAEGNMYSAPNGLGLSSATGFANTTLAFGARDFGILPPSVVVQNAAVNTTNYRTLLSSLDIQTKNRSTTFSVGSSEVGGTGVVTNYPLDSTLVGAGKPVIVGRKFYFSSSTGNDGYTSAQAQNQATPWQTLQKLQRSVVSGAVIFLPGDTICFKRGDVFANGFVNGYCSMQWCNDGGTYFTAPSGTPNAPIVITNYGSTSLPLPNWLYPTAAYPVSTWKSREGRGIVKFAGVHDIIIDGIQSNDYRVPEVDKANPGYSGGWILGEWTQGTSGGLKNSYGDTSRRKSMVTRFIVRNCIFNNTIYGIQSLAAVDSKVTNNTFTNFKSSADTAGTHDIMAGAIEAIASIRTEISYNFIKGAWAKSGRIGSCNGLGGVGFDIFNLYNSRIAYNTIIDCSGAYEIGNLDRNDSNSGSQYDTFAFNKIINCGQFGYIHGSAGDAFQGNNHHLAFWNNVAISNNNDRQGGIGFGKDVYGDGQGFRPGTPNPWWFCRDPYNTYNPAGYPLRPTVSTTAGSNIITVSNATGISVGSVFFADDDTLLGINYKTVTVTAINGLSLTLSDPCTRTQSNYTCPVASGFYLPVSSTLWSNPSNSSYQNYGGHRFVMQYAGDNTLWGSNIDTMIDTRNNIFYWTTGVQGLYDRNRYKRSANIYYYLGGARYASALGGTLNYRGTKERAMTGGLLFKDTLVSIYPENWDIHLNDTSYARNNGVAISGFNKDFDGNNIVGVTPFIGLYKPSSTVTALTASVTTGTITCFNGTTNVTISATGGTPPYTGTGTFIQAATTRNYIVTDAVGATANLSVTLSQPADVTGSVSFTPITVQGGTTTVTITATGGTGAMTFSLDGGAYQSGTSFIGVTAGPHTISAKDANGCTHDFNFTVTYNISIIKSRLIFKN